MQRFETIGRQAGSRQFTQGMALDFSENKLNDSCIRQLASVLESMRGAFKGLVMRQLGGSDRLKLSW